MGKSEVLKYGKLYLIIDSKDNIMKMIPNGSRPNARGEFYDWVVSQLSSHAMHVSEDPDDSSVMYSGIEFKDPGWYMNGRMIISDDMTSEKATIHGETYYLITGQEYFKIDLNITATKDRIDRLYAEMLEEMDQEKIVELVTKVVAEQRKFYLSCGYLYGHTSRNVRRIKDSEQWKNRRK